MDVRYSTNPEDMKHYTTSELRKEFLIENLFEEGKINVIYSHVDRVITAGCMITDKQIFLADFIEENALGTSFFLERREAGIINVGSCGKVEIDGELYELGNCDGLYVGMGSKDIKFSSENETARFYITSAPAHKTYPTRRISADDAKMVELGSVAESNKRVIRQYLHPAVLETCQLSMGVTFLDQGCVWNTMPCHTHERRMEVYFYFNMDEGLVFHYMGKPDETRHIVIRNEQAVISPSWSIHSGCGTRNYSFIWSMAGENKVFDDMDFVAINYIK